MFTDAGQRPKLRKKTHRLKSEKSVNKQCLLLNPPTPFIVGIVKKNLVSLSDGSY